MMVMHIYDLVDLYVIEENNRSLFFSFRWDVSVLPTKQNRIRVVIDQFQVCGCDIFNYFSFRIPWFLFHGPDKFLNRKNSTIFHRHAPWLAIHVSVLFPV